MPSVSPAMKFRFFVRIFSCCLLGGPAIVSTVDFENEIKPILRNKCGKCHTGPKAKGKLRYDNAIYFAQRIGGDDPVVIPGKPLGHNFGKRNINMNRLGGMVARVHTIADELKHLDTMK